jgi:hypothetical protein
MHLNRHHVSLWYVVSDRCVETVTHFLSLTTSSHHALHSQYWCNIATGGGSWNRWNMEDNWECKLVSDFRRFENNKTKLLVAFKCCDSFEYIAILDLHWNARIWWLYLKMDLDVKIYYSNAGLSIFNVPKHSYKWGKSHLNVCITFGYRTVVLVILYCVRTCSER